MDPGTLTTPDKVGEGLAAPRQEPRLRTLVLLTFYSTLCKSYIIILSLLSPRLKDWRCTAVLGLAALTQRTAVPNRPVWCVTRKTPFVHYTEALRQAAVSAHRRALGWLGVPGVKQRDRLRHVVPLHTARQLGPSTFIGSDRTFVPLTS